MIVVGKEKIRLDMRSGGVMLAAIKMIVAIPNRM